MKSLAQRFLDHVGETDNNLPVAATAMGLNKREFELFQGALGAIENSDVSLVIPDLNRTVRALRISPIYIQNLKRADCIDRGAARGEWVITKKAMRKVEAYMKDVAEGHTPPPPPEEKKRKSKGLGSMRLDKIQEKLTKIDSKIAGLKTECATKVRVIQAECDEEVASLRTEREEIVALVKSLVDDLK